MIYLSRLILNPVSRAVWRDLADCQAMHRTIMAAFPRSAGGDEGARAQFGVLFRVESAPRGASAPLLLIQSGVLPDWTRLPVDYLLTGEGSPENPACKRVDQIYGAIGAGTVLRFRLRANPTRKIDTRSGESGVRRNGRRVALSREPELLAWLDRKGEQGGFRLITARGRSSAENVLATSAGRVTGRRGGSTAEGRASESRLTFRSVVFDGVLVVTDAARFQVTLERGIGSGKAYGFGLLSIARHGG
jgi:CRISPR system Cascade subunit CasE